MSTRLVVAMILAFFGGALAADAPGDLEIQESRPLGKVVSKVSHLYGYLVTYEEAQYDDGSELTTNVYPDGTRFRYPAWKPVAFHLPPAASESDEGGPIQMVQSLVEQYNASGNPGRFTAISDGEYIHVVPAGRTVGGRIEYFQPILDTTVAPASQADSCGNVLNNLIDQVGKLRGVKIVLGVTPMSPLIRYQCNVQGTQGTGLTARQALKQVLEQMGRSIGDYDGNRWT